MTANHITNVVAEIKEKVRFDELFREYYPDNLRSNNMALCPWHGDTSPSLSLKKTAGLCHGACKNGGSKVKNYDIYDLHRKRFDVDFAIAKKELAERCGLTVQPKKKKQGGTFGGEWIYCAVSGEPYHKAVRINEEGGGKHFELWHWHAATHDWVKGLNKTRPIIYHSPEVKEAQEVWIAEGEKCCDRLAELGFCTTTNPMGAEKWHVVCADLQPPALLEGKDIIILPDADDTGQRHGQQVATNLRGFARSVKVVILPDVHDVYDFIEKHGHEKAKALLIEIAEKTPEYEPPRTGPEIVSCRDLIESELPPPKWIIRDLLPEGLSLLVAKPKAGKSWLCQNMALSIAMGTKALGHFHTELSATLNLCLEDNHRRMRERLSLMLGESKAPDNHLIACAWPAFDKGGLDHIEKTLEENPEIRLVTIDTFGRFRPRRGRTDDVYSSDYGDLQQLHALASRHEIGILLVHHSRKEVSEDIVDSILGSTALSGAADSLLILKRKSRVDPDATLYVSGRDIQDGEHALSFEAGVWIYQGNPLDLRLTAERREIRDLIRDGGKPLGVTEISEKLDKKYKAIDSLVRRMLDKGDLVRSVGSKGKFTLPPEDDLYGEPWKPGRETTYGQEEIDLENI